MKKLLPFLAFFVWTNFVQSQTDTSLQFTEVIQLDSSVTSTTAYEKGMQWMAATFKSSKSAIQVQDKEAGQIIAKGNLPFSLLIPMGSPGDGYINLTISLFFKEARTKIVVSDFVHSIVSYGYPSFGEITSAEHCPPSVTWTAVGQKLKDKNWIAMQQTCTQQATALIADYKKFILAPAQNDW